MALNSIHYKKITNKVDNDDIFLRKVYHDYPLRFASVIRIKYKTIINKLGKGLEYKDTYGNITTYWSISFSDDSVASLCSDTGERYVFSAPYNTLWAIHAQSLHGIENVHKIFGRKFPPKDKFCRKIWEEKYHNYKERMCTVDSYYL